MRIALAFLLMVYGLFHLLVFLAVWRIVPQLTAATSFTPPEPLPRVAGLIWLLACSAFVGAATMLLVRSGQWWLAAGFGIVVSQLLAIYAWPDVKFGTVVNIALIVPVVFAWADARFRMTMSAGLLGFNRLRVVNQQREEEP